LIKKHNGKLKKILLFAGIAVLLLVCGAAYFKPLYFTHYANENSKITLIINEYGLKNGEPDISAAV